MEKVSIIVGCANRGDVLIKSIPTWLARPEVGEVIVVDWNSSRPVATDLNHLRDKRLKIIRVNNCGGWVLSLALNVASRYVTLPLILKLDTDNILESNFFSTHPLKTTDRIFYTGNWQNARDENESHLNGVVFLPTHEFKRVSGYNEYIRSYGYDDTDLYARLSKNGMEKRDISNDTIRHIPHDNSKRSDQQDLELLILQNMYLCEKCIWLGGGPETEYVKHHGIFGTSASAGNYDVLTPTNLEKFTPSAATLEACNISALRNILCKNGFPWESTERKSRSFLHELYLKRKLPKIIIEPKNGLGNKLRAVASAAVIAQAQNRNLLIVWIPDVHYQAKFNEHFDDSQLCVVSKPIPGQVPIANIAPTSKGGCNSFAKPIDFQTILNDIYIVSATIISDISTTWAKECKWIQNHIQPLSWIQKKIDYFKNLFGIRKTIGVHIRMGQEASKYAFEDWSNYSAAQRKEATQNRGECHYTHFMAEMEKHWARDPNQRFFLCADSEQIYKEFERKYPQRYGNYIVHTEKDSWDRSSGQLTNAVIDVFLLSMCSEVYGSAWSSFTELAQRLGQPRVKVAGRDFGSKKFAMLFYPTSRNIGDDIQSIAARQFLPTIDYLIDRDDQTVVYDYQGKGIVDVSHVPEWGVKIVQNGWFDGRQTRFPPHKILRSLFVSFHLNETPGLYKEKDYARLAETARHGDRLLTPEIIKYFQNCGGAVGTRDEHTLKIFSDNGIRSFHTACLTLTLEGKRIGLNPPPSHRSSVIAVDAYHRELELYANKVPAGIRTRAEKISHGLTDVVIPSFLEKQTLATSLLQRYQDARVVITDRLHVALPCLAFGTPVFFIYSRMDHDPRYDNTFKALLGNGRDGPIGWDWNNPRITDAQTALIVKLKEDITKRVRTFISEA